jgi:hypothetical protein
MAEMEADSHGMTPDQFEERMENSQSEPCQSSVTLPLPTRPLLTDKRLPVSSNRQPDEMAMWNGTASPGRRFS